MEGLENPWPRLHYFLHTYGHSNLLFSIIDKNLRGTSSDREKLYRAFSRSEDVPLRFLLHFQDYNH